MIGKIEVKSGVVLTAEPGMDSQAAQRDPEPMPTKSGRNRNKRRGDNGTKADAAMLWEPERFRRSRRLADKVMWIKMTRVERRCRATAWNVVGN